MTEQDKPNRWYFYEIYASEQAYQSHRQTAHFKAYISQSANLVERKQAIAITPNLLINKGGLAYTCCKNSINALTTAD